MTRAHRWLLSWLQGHTDVVLAIAACALMALFAWLIVADNAGPDVSLRLHTAYDLVG